MKKQNDFENLEGSDLLTPAEIKKLRKMQNSIDKKIKKMKNENSRDTTRQRRNSAFGGRKNFRKNILDSEDRFTNKIKKALRGINSEES